MSHHVTPAKEQWIDLKERVEKAIKEKMSIFAVNMDPLTLASQHLAVPLSAPLVERIHPFSAPINLPDLLKLVKEITSRQKRLKFQPTCPRSLGRMDFII